MLITDPKELPAYYTSQRIWQGVASIGRSPKGRLFATFYSGGIKEELGNYCLLIQSDDDGFTWSEPIAVAFNGNASRCFDACLWTDPNGRLWWNWAIQPEDRVMAAICEEPDAETLVWSEPFELGKGIMMNKPIVTSAGEWLFPVALWDKRMCFLPFSEETDRRPFVYRSNDAGRTFMRLGGPEVEKRSFDEHMVLELRDSSLLMLTRTGYGISKSLSYDGGLTWTGAVNSGIPGPCSRFHLRRLQSGNILLVNHYKFKGRNNLTAMISRDECETWEGFLMLDERDEVSYPDSVEAPDGSIYIIYDRERGGFLKSLEQVYGKAREILMAKVTEADILAGKICTEGSRLRQLVNRLGEYCGPLKNPFGEIGRLSDDEYVALLMQDGDNQKILDRIFRDYGRCCIGLTAELSGEIDRNSALLLSGECDSDPTRKAYVIKSMVSVLRATASPEKAPSSNLLTERIFRLINDTLTRNISLEEMAGELYISKYYMCHLFHEQTGSTVIQYKNSRRVQAAKKLLIGTELSISEIGEQTGFESASYFTEWFRKSEGLTPTEYRAAHLHS